MKISVNICTYNEKANIELMVKAIAGVRKKLSSHDLHLLFVDDTSPDGTYKEVSRLQKKYKWLHLLLRKEKQGLGAAHVAGMKYAVEKLKVGAFIEMDADFQHRPIEILDLVAALDEGYDYVIGSRYIQGGSIPKEWEFNRKFLSVIGNLVARVLLILPQIHDVTTGFKLTRVEGFFDKLSLEIPKRRNVAMLRSYGREKDHGVLFSTSFAYKIQLLFEMVQAGAKVKEVPIKFEPRNTGESKIIKNELFETLRVIFMLQKNNSKIRQFVKFGIVGFIGYIVQAISLQILTWMSSPEWLIWGGSAELAIASNFTWNNLWTFRDKKIKGKFQLLNKFFHFNLTSGGAIVIQMIAGTVLVNMFGEEYRQLYLPLIIGFLIVPYNYFIYTKVIWRKNE